MKNDIHTLSYGKLANIAMMAALNGMPEEKPVLLVQTMANYKSGVHEREPYGRVLALAKQATARDGAAHVEQVWQHVDLHPELLADRVRHADSDYGHKICPSDHKLGKQPYLNMHIIMATHDVKRTCDDSTDLHDRYQSGDLSGSYTVYLNEQAPHVEMVRLGLRNSQGEDEWGPWLIGVHAVHASALDGPAIVAYPHDPWYGFWTTTYERYRNTAKRWDRVEEQWGDEESIYRKLEASHFLGLAIKASREGGH